MNAIAQSSWLRHREFDDRAPVGVAIGVAGLAGVQALRTGNKAVSTSQPAKTMPTSYYDLLAMTPEELAKVDIALMNLLCAKGLPGAENLDIPAILKQLDEWAAKVKFETERHLYRVKDPRYAEHYAHSEARLRPSSSSSAFR